MENKTPGEQKPTKDVLDELLQKSKSIKEKAKEAAEKLNELKAKTE